MSRTIYNSLVSSIEFYEYKILGNVQYKMFPHLEELRINKIKIFKNLIEIVGNKTDNYYNNFYKNYLKMIKLNNIYFDETNGFSSNKFNTFNDINDFINKIKSSQHVDKINFFNEINLIFENLMIVEIKQPVEKKKKKTIPAAIKKLVWNNWIGEEIGKAKCLCCKSTDITQLSFNCGHVISEIYGGETIVSNLRPICQNCNSSMGTKNMNDFIKTLS